MEHSRSKYRIAKMAQGLQVSKSGYYAWRRRIPGARQLASVKCYYFRIFNSEIITALKDAVRHTRSTGGCILHSDRGSQYCSLDYQALAKEHGFISSMSRKGNCWDNAPMERFWGKLKQERLNEQHFQTREEARTAVFEYTWIFYNRKRIHEANGYLTPEEYYHRHRTDLKAA